VSTWARLLGPVAPDATSVGSDDDIKQIKAARVSLTLKVLRWVEMLTPIVMVMVVVLLAMMATIAAVETVRIIETPSTTVRAGGAGAGGALIVSVTWRVARRYWARIRARSVTALPSLLQDEITSLEKEHA
jgi:hypothetical protein